MTLYMTSFTVPGGAAASLPQVVTDNVIGDDFICRCAHVLQMESSPLLLFPTAWGRLAAAPLGAVKEPRHPIRCPR